MWGAGEQLRCTREVAMKGWFKANVRGEESAVLMRVQGEHLTGF